MFSTKRHHVTGIVVLLAGLLLGPLGFLPTARAATLNDLLGKQQLDETERRETLERIESIQEKLKLLQEKLRALERRKAGEAAQGAEGTPGAMSAAPIRINWLPIDESTTDPGEFGLYTYLLFKGELSDTAAVGLLEDFILTIETLPAIDIPAGLANRFLVPVEKPQSMISLGRQPYDFRLNESYLRRLELQDKLPTGPVLVTTQAPIDPFGNGEPPAFLAVSLGRQSPQRALALAGIWHRQEMRSVASDEDPVHALAWEVIDGAGPTQVTRYRQRVLVALPQQ